jgi:prepilin-type N-terminal cleavage/methylation domain-containing protein
MPQPVKNRGFTLVEIMVAISIFAIVAVITVGALITLNTINKQAQAIKLAMDNLNFAVDSMTFQMKQGWLFECRDLSGPTVSLSEGFGSWDCPSGENGIVFTSPKFTTSSSPAKRVAYKFESGKIYSCSGPEGGSCDFTQITNGDLGIEALTFIVTNSDAGSQLANISLYGTARVGQQTQGFAIQTSVAER